MRVAVIGYGLAGSVFHAPLVAATDGLEVATIVTSNPERQEQAHRDHPGARIVDSADGAWDADLVGGATPNHTHAPLARQAIERDVAGVLDKPPPLSGGEAGRPPELRGP